jgi:hypothetical protein
MDCNVHVDIHADAIIQHKAFARRRQKGNPMTIMVPPTGGPANWKEHKDGRNRCLSSSASFSI